MYPITNEVKALFEAEQRKVLRITGADKNGAVISITDNDVIADSFQVDRYSCNGEKLEVGTAIAAQMTMTLENGGGQYNGIVFEGAELFVEVGIADWTQSSPTITYVPCGYFTPDMQPRRLSTISITALDRMTKFDVVVDAADLTFPTTVAGLVGQVCTLCGVTLAQSISGLFNASVAVTELPTVQGEITYRNLIQWCAGIMGTNAWFDWNGQLRFSWYANATGYTSTVDNRYSSDLYEDDLTISGVEYTNDSGIVIVEGTDDYAIDLTGNAIAGPLVATVLPPLNVVLNGFTYRPFTAAVINAPYLWPMDVVTFTDKNGNDHTSVLTNVAFGLNGTTAMESKGMTYAINKLAQPKGFTREQAQLVNQAMEHVEKDIDDSLTQQEIFNRLTDDGAAQGLILYNGQLYINASYINAGYLSADRIAAGAISADKIAAGAITADKIAANAITASKIAADAITADMITSGEMSAARIKGGTLTLGGSGNTRGTLQILNGFNQVCGGWDNSQMFSNRFQLTHIVDGELVVWGTIAPLMDGGIAIYNCDDQFDNIATFSPDQTSLHNRLYVVDGAIIEGVLRLPDEPLYVQYGGTGATTAAGARANLGVTPANIGAVAKTGDTMTGPLITNSAIIQDSGYIFGANENGATNHALKLGHAGDNVMQFFEYVGQFDFIKSINGSNTTLFQIKDGVSAYPLPVSNGGTNATTAAGALNNFLKQTSRTSIGSWNSSTSVNTYASFDKNTVAVYFHLWYAGNIYGGATEERFRSNSNDDIVILLGEDDNGSITRIGVSINWSTNRVTLKHDKWSNQYWNLSIYKRT